MTGRILLLVLFVVGVTIALAKHWKTYLGVVLIFVAGILFLFYEQISRISQTADTGQVEALQTIVLRYSPEKRGLLDDPRVLELLKSQHQIFLRPEKLSQPVLPEALLEKTDALWLSDRLAQERFETAYPDKVQSSRRLLQSPLVIYSWPEPVKALQRAGAIQEENGRLTADPVALARLLEKGERWELLGWSRPGPPGLAIAHPGESRVGAIAGGLLLWGLNQGSYPESEAIPGLMERFALLYPDAENMEPSGQSLFNQYLRQGSTAYPLIAAPEYLLIDLYQRFPKYREKINKRVRLIYPDPGPRIIPPFLALTPKGEKLATALADPRICAIAWRKYGFRPLERLPDGPGPDLDIADDLPPAMPLPGKALKAVLADRFSSR